MRQRKKISYPRHQFGSITVRSRISTSWNHSSVGLSATTTPLPYWFVPQSPLITAVGSS